jgi:hypothetical protein
MQKLGMILTLLLLLGADGCSATGTSKTADCPAGQASPCRDTPDHANSGSGGGGGMDHGMM